MLWKITVILIIRSKPFLLETLKEKSKIHLLNISVLAVATSWSLATRGLIKNTSCVIFLSALKSLSSSYYLSKALSDAS